MLLLISTYIRLCNLLLDGKVRELRVRETDGKQFRSRAYLPRNSRVENMTTLI